MQHKRAGVKVAQMAIMTSMSVHPQEIASELKSLAQSVGLAGLAIGPAAPLVEAAERLRERIARGYAGHYGLVEGSEEKFCHPEALLEGARSIIACALPYRRGVEPEPRQPGELLGLSARLARGRDYHIVIREKMEIVAGRLQELAPGARTRILHDTGPLLDRAAAHASGLGWYGKNACFFVPRFGSWVVLGEIITDVDLPHDPPIVEDHCGDCALCMSACPTGAIRSPYQVDLNRCVSHLTQMGGIVPRELRHFMSNMVFGCDICQEVCPQNDNSEPASSLSFEPGAMPASVDLIRLLNMTKSEFEQTLKTSSAGWIGRNRLRRNACIALGNLREPAALPTLRDILLRDDSHIVRAHAAWALGEIATEEAFAALEDCASRETNPEVLEELRESLYRKTPALGAK